MYRIKTESGCINNIYDEKNNQFHIPNFCINDPYLVKELSEEKDKNPEILNVGNIRII